MDRGMFCKKVMRLAAFKAVIVEHLGSEDLQRMVLNSLDTNWSFTSRLFLEVLWAIAP